MTSPTLKLLSGFRVATRQSVRYCALTTSNPSDVETHTGQKFANDDVRNLRFVGRPKHVNPNYAIKLIAEVPPIEVEARTTHCDGGSGPLGHPRIFINLDKPGNHSCIYCGLRFVQKHHHN